MAVRLFVDSLLVLGSFARRIIHHKTLHAEIVSGRIVTSYMVSWLRWIFL